MNDLGKAALQIDVAKGGMARCTESRVVLNPAVRFAADGSPVRHLRLATQHALDSTRKCAGLSLHGETSRRTNNMPIKSAQQCR
ncbi:hypothetical protein XP315_11495 [Xanthomonas perforans]|uniref:Uncharacterized protein n=1 Tax=Xanthomonas perforans TaxID=442694 RepID=A0ABR5ERC5_XANPE|nr:hypothetical protein XP315_11495 [Xanthomonas perforans]